MRPRLLLKLWLLVALLAPVGRAGAVELVIDYTYDTQSFFGAGNPDGAAAGGEARARLEEAAAFFSAILDDDFSPITLPPDYIATAPGAPPVTTSWEWSVQFPHPGIGLPVTIDDPSFAADEYRIYAGGRSIPGSTLGIGGPGGFGSSVQFQFYTQAQLAEMQQINQDFNDAINNRGGSAGDFAGWGGAITFDSDSSTDWHYGESAPGNGESDFLSVALHELGHALGLVGGNNGAAEFNQFVSGSFFVGPEATAANGGTPPRLHTDFSHLRDDDVSLESPVYGGTTLQEPAMDPTILTGTRKLFTELDAALLDDIGWDVIALPPLGLAGDYNDDGRVDAADYTVWRDGGSPDPTRGGYDTWDNNYGATAPSTALSTLSTTAAIPEPTSLAVLLTALAAARRRR